MNGFEYTLHGTIFVLPMCGTVQSPTHNDTQQVVSKNAPQMNSYTT